MFQSYTADGATRIFVPVPNPMTAKRAVGVADRTTDPVQAGCSPERTQTGWIKRMEIEGQEIQIVRTPLMLHWLGKLGAVAASTKSGWIGSHEGVRECVRRYPGWSTQACSRLVVK
jgi:hypothetical protein